MNDNDLMTYKEFVASRTTNSSLIKTFRPHLKLTQEHLGRLLGVRQDTVSRWEKSIGISEHMPISKLCKFAQLLGVSVEDLMYRYRAVNDKLVSVRYQ